MNDCGHAAGDPDCPEITCRTRWLVGSTTCEPHTPCSVSVLLLDILETWRGCWLSADEIVDNALRIKPQADEWSVRRQIRHMAARGGGKWPDDPRPSRGEWVDGNGRVHGAGGGFIPMPGRWVTVECKSDPYAGSSDSEPLLRVSWGA